MNKHRPPPQSAAEESSCAGGARRPSGAEEGEAACRGRRGGGLSSPTRKQTRALLCLAPLAFLAEAPAGKPEAPTQIVELGRLVCLAEEMKQLWQAEVPPVHDHILGFRTEPAQLTDAKPSRHYTLLRTAHSEALFFDRRFQGRTLELTGRVFPGTGILEVRLFRWLRDGKLVNLHYWCEVCSIRGIDPGPCACCQGEVELRESGEK